MSDVHLATDRSSGRLRGHAFVTMANEADAHAAMRELNGSLFDDRRLRVNIAGEERDRTRSKEVTERTRITSQFRERLNMTYELDCGGVSLTLKMFPDDAREQSWRVEASTKGGGMVVEGAVMAASGRTRATALEELARSSQASGALALDWTAIIEALAAVRAI
ncbi:RNA-binding protein [Labilithrix luteola]|uniref:RNA-binding protein n=1 Tax=Labilithrix luteola TaxID=1391654 RepID=A0A0K1Q3G4_9BACT|nr:RNA-binding protein [Labilithrix luteola]